MTRQEAVLMIENDIRLHHDYLSGNYRKALRMAISALAQSEQKKGRWIDMDDNVMCSCCGATHYGADKNFCPNCGADMRKVKK